MWKWHNDDTGVLKQDGKKIKLRLLMAATYGGALYNLAAPAGCPEDVQEERKNLVVLHVEKGEKYTLVEDGEVKNVIIGKYNSLYGFDD
ncbi:MAG: hypothetical protein LUD27_04235 [Clostridia bacterium]|nr:hypothetical protein [Clostridia bacterium]